MKTKGRRQSSNVTDLTDATPLRQIYEGLKASFPLPAEPIPQRVNDDMERAASVDRQKIKARSRTRMESVLGFKRGREIPPMINGTRMGGTKLRKGKS